MIEPYATPCYCISVQRLASDLTAAYNEALAPFGVTVNQFSLMFHIQKLGPCNRTELAQFTRLERTTIVRNARALASKGLVVEKPGPTKRNGLLELSAEGEQTVEACLPAWRAVQDKVAPILAPLDPSTIRKMSDQLATEESPCP